MLISTNVFFRQQTQLFYSRTHTKIHSVINSFLSKYFSIDFRSIVNCKKIFKKQFLNEFLKIEYFLNN